MKCNELAKCEWGGYHLWVQLDNVMGVRCLSTRGWKRNVKRKLSSPVLLPSLDPICFSSLIGDHRRPRDRSPTTPTPAMEEELGEKRNEGSRNSVGMTAATESKEMGLEARAIPRPTCCICMEPWTCYNMHRI